MSEREGVRALWVQAIEAANDALQDRRTPRDVARELDRLRSELVVLEEALRPFVGLTALWDYDPARESEFRQQVLTAAESLRRNYSDRLGSRSV